MLPPWMLAEGTGGGTGGTALVLPSLLLDFPGGGPVPAGLTVTRATHKLQEYPAGTVTDKGNNVGSQEAAGLAIEAAHTNFLQNSNAFSTSPWQTTGAVLTPAATTAPDGTNTGWLLDLTAGAFYQLVGAGLGAAVPTAPSFWMKASSTSGTINMIDGVTGPGGGEWNINLALLSTTAWQRVSATHPAVTVVTPFVSNGGGAGGPFFSAVAKQVYIWQADFVPAKYARSAITTASATGACNLDAVAGSAGQVSALPVATGRVAVTFTPEWSTANSPTTAALLDTRSATPNNGFALTVASNKLTWIGEAGTPLQSAALTWVAGTQYTVMAVWNGTTVTLYRDGASVATGASTQPAGQTALKIGQLYDGSAPLDGHVANVAFFRS